VAAKAHADHHFQGRSCLFTSRLQDCGLPVKQEAEPPRQELSVGILIRVHQYFVFHVNVLKRSIAGTGKVTSPSPPDGGELEYEAQSFVDHDPKRGRYLVQSTRRYTRPQFKVGWGGVSMAMKTTLRIRKPPERCWGID
jgi:hypothetical protein